MLIDSTNYEEQIPNFHGKILYLDCETTGLKSFSTQTRPGDRACGVAIRVDGKSAYVTLRHANANNLTPDQRSDFIRRLSEFPEIRNHNMKFDLLSLHQDGLPVPAKIRCTYIGAKMFNENEPLGLKPQADKYLGANSSHESHALDQVLRGMGLGKAEMWRLRPEMVAPYAEQDTKLAQALDERLEKVLYNTALYEKSSEFVRVLTQMEIWGLKVDPVLISVKKAEALKAAEEILGRVQKRARFPLNPNSPSQVAGYLGTKDATEESLLACQHPDAEAILDYKAWVKAVGSYYDRYTQDMDSTGRIHASMDPARTATTRLATSDPNFQAVPRDSAQYQVKDVIVADPGYILAELDLAQADLRVGAHYTGEPQILEMFKAGLDLHAETAKSLGIPRQVAKVINLSIQYGMGANTLARKLKVTKVVAQDYLDKYHQNFPGTRKMLRAAEKAADHRGYIELYNGRRLHFNSPDCDSRKAFPYVVQGSVAQMMMAVMIEVHNSFDHDECKMLLQVHDSLLLQIKLGNHVEVIAAVKEIMEDQPWCRCPIKADSKMGFSWGEMKSV